MSKNTEAYHAEEGKGQNHLNKVWYSLAHMITTFYNEYHNYRVNFIVLEQGP